jgi:DNA-directed RNA polymerase subunit L
MIKVINIKYETEPIEPSNKNFLRCVEYAKTMTDDYKKYLPNKPKESVSFELHNITSDLANTIRRFLCDEIFVYSMTLDEYDIKTTDEFILNDYVKKRIECIPIMQDMEKYDIDKFTINLHTENLTTNCSNVYTRDFEILYNNKPYTGDDFFSNNIDIFSLKPTKKINITNIKITKGVAKDDAGKFLLLSNIVYKILDSKPLEKTKFKRSGESSLNSNPNKFLFKITNHRNIKPKKILNICFDDIINRLDLIRTDIKNIKESDINYISDLTKLETVGNFKLLYLIKEYWTIANIISRYCYLQDKDIDFVCSSIIHPTTEISIIKIKHKNYLKVLTNSIDNIIKDIKTIKAHFLKD